ncbi:MAG: peptidylprolyl isomerase [Ignavibacteriaceae bacterium]|nr:peptidylprolyl isomerase [Ignavibacterium sp.]MCC6254319.1 peptidylprolyl isomerase [Ignavibacteriaceae bacterium]HRN26722.1 peptidylprolyl isomerase [Ignavibacteriaceae bacterium]HRP93009.1 peptidylprolyl isomerase [Ignavibacteriaceae bacterium]
MKPLLIYKIIFISLFFSFASIAQNETDVLAIVGSDKITVEEFQNRFDYMPHLNYSSSDIDSIKKEFLYSLVAEKLWALEADELEIDTIETIQKSLKTLEKLFVKDELYKKEVESKINITSSEISTGLSRVTRILNTLIITLPDSDKAWKLFYDFQKGVLFDSVLVNLNMPLKPFEIKYASLEDEEMENIVYTLKLNEISKPVKSKDNWFIFKLVDDQPDITIDLSKDYARNIVIKKIKDRRSQKVGKNYLDELLIDKRITADRKLFDLLSDNLLEVIKNRIGKTENDSISDIQLLESDIKKVLTLITKVDLNADFISLDNNPATLNDFLYYAFYKKIYFDTFNPFKFKQALNKIVKQFIEDEIISRKGFELGLNNLPSVKNDLRIWRNYYISEILMRSYADSIKVSDEEINDYINPGKDNPTITLLNIIEIFIKDIDDCEKVLTELSNGKNFEFLAEIYNQREWTKQSKGEWGFFNSSNAGEIGRIAARLNVGDIYGPLKVNDGYSIFKLIDKKTQTDSPKQIIDKDSLKFIRIKIALSKMDNLLNKKTTELAKKYKINIDEQLLKKVETSQLNTFTYRLIGFGGKIAAFPITVPMYDWYKMYEQKKEIP